MAEERVRVDAGKLRRLAARELQAVGVPEGDAAIMADVLVTADLRGVETHGIVSLVGFYIRGIQEGRIDPQPEIKITEKGAAVATIDGGHGLGYAVTYRAMKKAIELAGKAGAGFVAVRNSTHYGPGFYYPMMALEHDMIGIALTNSPVPEVVPPGSSKIAVGTNPLSVAAPSNRKYPFVLDMATAVVAAGKFRKALLEGKPIPEGWAIDKNGKPMTDPGQRKPDNGGILPLGGTPELGVFKGFGLGVTIDIFTAILTGSAPEIFQTEKGTSHFVGAFNIGSFIPVDTFKARMDEMIEAYDSLPKLPGVEHIYIAGGYEAEVQKDREANGIPLWPEVIQTLKDAAEELGVEFDL